MNTSNLRPFLTGLALAALPFILVTEIWEVCANAANGARYDWTEVGVHLTLLSVLVIASEVFFVLLLLANSSSTESGTTESKPDAPEAPVIVVTMPPTHKPLIGRKESIALIGAGVAGVVGALLTSFIMKRRG